MPRHTLAATSAGLASATALGVALTLLIPTAAQAAPVVSQANGRLVSTTLLTTGTLDSIASLRGASAVNEDGSTDVVRNTPIDATALEAVNVQSGGVNLFGTNGIIQLGAVGQYAVANADGSSAAFSGAVSQAPSLVGVAANQVSASNLGAPAGNSSAQITLGAPTSAVSLDVRAGALAASARQTVDGAQTGQYTVGALTVNVGGTTLANTLSTLRGALQPVTAALGIANPISTTGTVQVSLAELLTAAGVTDINQLPPNTNLLQYVPAAVTAQVTQAVNGVLAQAQAEVTRLGPVLGATLSGVLSIATATLTPVLTGLNSTLTGPLGTAIDGIAQLNVNVKANGADGSFTQTALRVGLLNAGALTTVDLASATVGPNAGRAAVPIANPASAGIAGGVGLLVAAAFALTVVRRRQALAVAR
ncbi:choice-of-anchor G family protein [Curtobacterium albidum]|uniref:PVV-CTERM domain-containing choice-of-anchor G protein n=1 Tax=Curtobacterium citreum TaxID=2036 RepID=UPI00202625D9|nr:choice-of-anchor G family protein [Curtobacterium albidum]MCL9666281.1 choice-of-anchor G family protein [Curtobacterium albidum]